MVGVKSDGTVVVAGLSYFGQCDVGSWMLNLTFPCTSAHKGGGTVILSLQATFPFLLLGAPRRLLLLRAKRSNLS